MEKPGKRRTDQQAQRLVVIDRFGLAPGAEEEQDAGTKAGIEVSDRQPIDRAFAAARDRQGAVARERQVGVIKVVQVVALVDQEDERGQRQQRTPPDAR